MSEKKREEEVEVEKVETSLFASEERSSTASSSNLLPWPFLQPLMPLWTLNETSMLDFRLKKERKWRSRASKSEEALPRLGAQDCKCLSDDCESHSRPFPPSLPRALSFAANSQQQHNRQLLLTLRRDAEHQGEEREEQEQEAHGACFFFSFVRSTDEARGRGRV